METWISRTTSRSGLCPVLCRCLEAHTSPRAPGDTSMPCIRRASPRSSRQGTRSRGIKAPESSWRIAAWARSSPTPRRRRRRDRGPAMAVWWASSPRRRTLSTRSRSILRCPRTRDDGIPAVEPEGSDARLPRRSAIGGGHAAVDPSEVPALAVVGLGLTCRRRGPRPGGAARSRHSSFPWQGSSVLSIHVRRRVPFSRVRSG